MRRRRGCRPYMLIFSAPDGEIKNSSSSTLVLFLLPPRRMGSHGRRPQAAFFVSGELSPSLRTSRRSRRRARRETWAQSPSHARSPPR